jgi:hypothetical protein
MASKQPIGETDDALAALALGVVLGGGGGGGGYLVPNRFGMHKNTSKFRKMLLFIDRIFDQNYYFFNSNA